MTRGSAEGAVPDDRASTAGQSAACRRRRAQWTEPRLVLQLPLDVGVLPLMRSRMRQFLEAEGLSEDIVDDLILGTQEACKNAIRHSNSPRGVLVYVTADRWEAVVSVRDYGIGISREAMARIPSPLAERGRGLQIIRLVMDDVQILTSGGTEVRMRKRLPPDESGLPRLPLSA